jgi:hypothetical protein
VLSKGLSREIQTNGYFAFTVEDLKVPRGYIAKYGGFAWSATWEGDPERAMVFLIGVNYIKVKLPASTPLLSFDGDSFVVPISINGFGFKSMTLNVEVFCQLLPEEEDKWRLNTYNAIMAAYNKARSDYEEKVAAAQIQQGVAIGGDNPLINREIERQQLKRSCLTIWTGYMFNNPAGINQNVNALPPGNYPEINLANALAAAERTRFFEDMFEWQNITYELYPYYWSRKSVWVDKLSLSSTDPIFEEFLRAGAARVVVPVRPLFTETVLFYQLTGVMWNGGPIPSISGLLDPDVPLYNGYLQDLGDVSQDVEIEKDIDIKKDDPNSWITKVPTNLVWLQGDRTLPDFENP